MVVAFDATMIKRIIKASAMTPYWTEYEKGKLTYEEAMENGRSYYEVVDRDRSKIRSFFYV